jgi:pyruvate/2-oxoglutarate dehydrogenase complex dihydrolipoamide acyltransferase (E2) component
MEVVVPKWGLTVDSVVIMEKFRADGDMVKEGEPICGVETDKATAEIEATGTGILTWAVEVNDEVAVGEVVARIQAVG